LKSLTDARYGLAFIPQLGAAILDSVAGEGLARRVGLKSLLVVALAANARSQLGLLAATVVFVKAGKELAKIDSLSGIFSPSWVTTACFSRWWFNKSTLLRYGSLAYLPASP
jgi:hypothetical protein